MSSTVDERVVSLQFDNAQFERNVRTSMNTLNELNNNFANTEAAGYKAGLHLSDIWAKMSSVFEWDVARKITRSLTDLAKSFTIDPINSGLKEYELKMNSVQTIMMSTGESVQTVNKYLDELNKYSDETIYSFQDMTSNIGKFTNAGVKLEDAVLAIKGISNEAAVSGANANEASRAMYNFSQALSAGYVKLIDWKSIENANMATVEFKTQLLESAVACGTLTKAEDGMYKTTKGTLISATHEFNDSLQQQWMTTDVLVNTLGNYATDVRDMTEAEKLAYETKLRGMGYTEEQIEKIEKLGSKSKDAATQIKTFSQMMDVLKESAQSGWATTWQLIFGDLEQAKALFTSMTDFFSGIIESVDNFRNGILEEVLGTGPFQAFNDKFSELTEVVGVGEVALKDFDKIVSQVIDGDFGNGKSRIEALKEAGYDWAKIQNLVNEQLGSNVRYTERLSEVQEETAKSLSELSDEQLRNYGFTEEEIELFRALDKEASKAGMSLQDYIKQDARFAEQMSGRDKLINAVKVSGRALYEVIKQVAVAWHEMFPNTKDTIANSITAVINAFDRFASSLGVFVEDADGNKVLQFTDEFKERLDQVKNVLKGVFAALDLVRMVIGAGLKIVITVVNKLLSYFNLDILSAASGLGKLIVAFRDWVKENDFIVKGVDLLFAGIKKLCSGISNLIKAAQSMPLFIKAFEKISEIGKFVVEGFKNGFEGKVGEVINSVINFGKRIIEAIKNVLGIHSPSKVTFALGEFTAEGFLNGFKSFISNINWNKIITAGISLGIISAVGKLISTFGKLVNVFQTVADGVLGLGKMLGGVGNILSAGADVLRESSKSISKVIKTFTKIEKAFAKVVKASAKVVKAFAKVVDGFAKIEKAIAKKFRAEAFKTNAQALVIMAASIAIVAAAIVGVAIAVDKLGMEKVLAGAAIISVIALLLVGIANTMSNMSGGSVEADIKKGHLAIKGINTTLIGLGMTLAGLAMSVLAITAAVKIFGGMEQQEFEQGLIGLLAICAGLSLILTTFGKFVQGQSAKNINKLGSMLIKLSISLLLLCAVMKIIGHMSPDELTKGATAIAIFMGIVVGLGFMTKVLGKAGSIDSFSKFVVKMAVAFGLMAITAKVLGSMSTEELKKSGLALVGFAGIIALFGLITKMVGKTKEGLNSVSKAILAMSASTLIMAGAIKIIAKIDQADIDKSLGALAGFVLIIGAFAFIAKKFGEGKMSGLPTTMLAMTLSVGILAGLALALSFVDTESLKKGLIAVGVLSACMALMIAASKNVQSNMGSLIVMDVAVGLLVAAVIGLSFIDPNKLIPATAALGALMVCFGVMSKLASNVKSGIGTLLLMSVAVGILAGILVEMTMFSDPNALIPTAIALGGLLLAVSASLAVCALVSKFAPNALMGVLALLAICVPVAALAGILMLMDGLQNATENAIVIGALVAALSLVLIPLSLVGAMGMAGLPFLGATALLALCIPIVALAGILMLMDGLKNATENAILIGDLVLKLSVALLPLTLVGAFAMAALAGIGMLGVLIIAIGALAISIGALMEKFPKLEEFLNKGLPILNKVGEGIGLFVSGIVNGFLNNLDLSSLETLGDQLSSFMEKLQPFLDGAAKVKDDAVNGVKNITSMILALTGSSIIEKIGSWFGGGSKSLAKFAEEIGPVGESLGDFAKKTASVNTSSIGEVTSAMESLSSGMKKLGGIDSKKIENFKQSVNTLATTDLAGLISAFSNASDASLSSGEKIVTNLTKGMTNKSSGAETAAKGICTKIQNAFKSVYSEFTSIGTTLIEKVTSAMSKQKSAVNSAAKDAISGAAQKLRDKYDDFKSAGKYLVEGFAKGISSNSSIATNAAATMASDVEQKVRKVLKINSPSKIFIPIGSGVPEGMAKGIGRGTVYAVEAAADMCDGVMDEVEEDMTRLNVADFLENGFGVDVLSKFATTDQDSRNLMGFAESLYYLSDAYASESAAAKQSYENIERYGELRERNAKHLAIELGTLDKLQNDESYDVFADAQSQLENMTDAESERKSLIEGYISTENSYKSSIESENKALRTNTTTLAANRSRYEELKKQQEETAVALYNARQEYEANTAAYEEAQAQLETTTEVQTDNGNIFTKVVALAKDKVGEYTNILELFTDGTKDAIKTSDTMTQASEDAMEASRQQIDVYEQQMKAQALELAEISEAIIDQQKEIAKAIEEEYERTYREIRTKIEEYLDLSGIDYSDHISGFFSDFIEIETKDLKTPTDILNAMQSQVEGVQKWMDDLETLSGKGLSDGLLNYLRGLGTSGVNEVQAFMQMTEEQISEANEWFGKKNNLAGQDLIANYQEKIRLADEYATKFEDLSAAVTDGIFDADILEEVMGMGVDEGSSFMDALLSLDEEQIKEFNEARATALALPDTVAKKVTASLVKASGDFATTFQDTFIGSVTDEKTINAEQAAVEKSLTDALAGAEPKAVAEAKRIGKAIADALMSPFEKKELPEVTVTLDPEDTSNNTKNSILGIKDVIDLDAEKNKKLSIVNFETAPTVSNKTVTVPSSITTNADKASNNNGAPYSESFAQELGETIRSVFDDEFKSLTSNLNVSLAVDGKMLSNVLAPSMNRELKTIYKREGN